jgi:hypothetical protein
MTKLVGGCLCGSVRYETPAPVLTLICHCRNCQKQSGAAFSVAVIAPSEGAVVEGPIQSYEDRGDTGAKVDRQFCARCGSAVITRIETHPELLIVKAGTLDDPATSGEPAAEIFCDRAFAWAPKIAARRFPRGATSAELFA